MWTKVRIFHNLIYYFPPLEEFCFMRLKRGKENGTILLLHPLTLFVNRMFIPKMKNVNLFSITWLWNQHLNQLTELYVVEKNTPVNIENLSYIGMSFSMQPYQSSACVSEKTNNTDINPIFLCAIYTIVIYSWDRFFSNSCFKFKDQTTIHAFACPIKIL